MILNHYLFWIIIGGCTSILYFKSQQWSVELLDPGRRNFSMRLILGGTILRWLFVFIVFGISMSYAYWALLLVFTAFIIVRLFFFFKWQGWLRLKKPYIRQS